MSHSQRPLHVLIVEDSPDDAELMMRALCVAGFAPNSTRVESATSMRAALEQGPWDIILCDYNLPGFSAASALDLFRELDRTIPFIVVSGTIGEENAAELMRMGAADVLRKANVASRLAHAVNRELAASEVRRSAVKNERRYREITTRLQAVVDTTVHGLVMVDGDGSISMFNPAAERLFSYRAAEIIGRNALMLLAPPFCEEYAGYVQNHHRTAEREILGISREVVGRRKDGSHFPMDLAIGEAQQNGKPIFVAVIVDLSERKREAAALRLWGDAFEKAAFGIAIVDTESGTLRQVNAAMARMHCTTVEEMRGMRIDDGHPAEERGRLTTLLATADRTGHVAFEALRCRKDGSVFPAQIDITSVQDADGRGFYRIASMFDISDRRQVEDQLRQSQKMEAIGNLTGGMAHDFNNLLGIIIGNLDLLRPLLAPESEPLDLADEALTASLRGAELTRRLLAFARRQPLSPQRVAPNDLISNIVKLLERTLGEQIVITLNLDSSLWPVVVDPMQLESAITNLANNARDAMPKGGGLTVATVNRHLDQDYAALHSEVTAGDYVLIEVSDTGDGIRPDELTKIFEPFYTTKTLGNGTGLGLSMVFGFVRQSGGHINVYSEPGIGTTFRLYLPRSHEGAVEAEPSTRTEAPRAGGETVLVVEDNTALRRVVVRQLTELGYAVLEVESGAAALAVLERRTIDVLFTDVVMPGEVDGYALAWQVAALWPSVKIVLTSGFTASTISGALRAPAPEARLLCKPYRKDDLACAIREALDT